MTSSDPVSSWGWMVVLSGFVQSALVFGVIRSFGVFFVEFVAYFEESSSTVSWIPSLGVAILQFASPLSSALAARYGARPVVVLGGCLAALGLMLASFSVTIVHLYLSAGLLTGLGWALVVTPSVATVAQYFERRRTLATGLAAAGAAAAALLLPPACQRLLGAYGWRGALRLLAALSLHLVAAGALLRPVGAAGGGAGGAGGGAGPARGPLLRYALAFALVDAGYFVPYAHLVARAREVGCGERGAAALLSAAAAADLGGRLAAGALASRARPLRSLTLWAGATGAALALLPLGRGAASLAALAACYGFAAGALVPLQYSALAEVVGAGHVLRAIGLMHMLESAGALLGTPLSGLLRDLTGSYAVSFVVAGLLLLAGTLVLFTMPNYFSCARPPSSKVASSAGQPDLEALELGGAPQQDRGLDQHKAVTG